MALANECIPLFERADRVTSHATGTITGKRFVIISGASQTDGRPSVAHGGAGTHPFGIASYDAASGADLVIIRGHVIAVVTCGADITAATEVEIDSSGRVIPIASGKAVGRALTAGTSGGDVTIEKY